MLNSRKGNQDLEDQRINVLVVQNQRLLNDLEQHNKLVVKKISELEKLKDLEYKVEVLSMKSNLSLNKSL